MRLLIVALLLAALTISCGSAHSSSVALPVASTIAEPSPLAESAPPFPTEEGAIALAVTLNDASIQIGHDFPPAGLLTLVVQNAGTVSHDLELLKTSRPADELPVLNGAVDERGLEFAGALYSIPAGQTERISLTLSAGQYALICNMPGDYQAGMHVALTVR